MDIYPSVQVRFTVGQGEGVQEDALAHEKLAGALILWCIDNKIPLPAKSQKILHVINGEVALIIPSDVPSQLLVNLLSPKNP